MGTSASDLPGPTPRRWGAPASKFDLLLVLRRHSRREQRRERHLVAGDGGPKQSAAPRRITPPPIQARAGGNAPRAPAAGAQTNPPPVEGSPPDVSRIVLGVMYSRAAWSTLPPPSPKSAARPPWGRPAAISAMALSAFSA